MRADRPLLASAVFLGAGLSIIFRYGTSGAEASTSLPWSNLGFHLNLAASGPAAIGGTALVVIGVVLLVWAIFAALAWHASLLFDRNDDADFLHILPSSPPIALDDSPTTLDDSSPAFDHASPGPLVSHRRSL